MTLEHGFKTGCSKVMVFGNVLINVLIDFTYSDNDMFHGLIEHAGMNVPT